jgi:hypothetical protein
MCMSWQSFVANYSLPMLTKSWKNFKCCQDCFLSEGSWKRVSKEVKTETLPVRRNVNFRLVILADRRFFHLACHLIRYVMTCDPHYWALQTLNTVVRKPETWGESKIIKQIHENGKMTKSMYETHYNRTIVEIANVFIHNFDKLSQNLVFAKIDQNIIFAEISRKATNSFSFSDKFATVVFFIYFGKNSQFVRAAFAPVFR